MIRSMLDINRYVIVVEHDLSVLDYLSDYICCLYGYPSAYGVVTMPFSVREGINIFLAGYVPSDNMRFRAYELDFHTAIETEVSPDELAEKERLAQMIVTYPAMTKTLGDFTL